MYRRRSYLTHPDLQELMGYHAGEWPPPRQSAIRAHLDNCPECHREACRLSSALAVSDPPDAGAFASILGTIRRVAAASEQPERTAEVKSRVAQQMQPFLGARATETILHKVSAAGDNLLSSVEPVVALFLGERAASRLVGNVVDRAILRPS